MPAGFSLGRPVILSPSVSGSCRPFLLQFARIKSTAIRYTKFFIGCFSISNSEGLGGLAFVDEVPKPYSENIIDRSFIIVKLIS